MKPHLILALTNPVDGKEEEYNKWYDSIAMPTYKSLPGLVPLGRFKAVDVPHLYPFEMQNQFKYLSLYYFMADDPEVFMENIKKAFSNRPEYEFSSCVDKDKFCEPIFAAIGDINFEPIDLMDELKRP
ncbi:MAG: DUF695 domain-containing protein [Bacteroidales bacterium]|nr:DUF695 domain-containing protein [Bacteroidales bacterium]